MVAATSEYGDIRLLCRQHELARLFAGISTLSRFSAAYGAGLRVFPGREPGRSPTSTVSAWRFGSRRAGAARFCYVMLSPQLLELLREWWRAARPSLDPVTVEQMCGRRPEKTHVLDDEKVSGEITVHDAPHADDWAKSATALPI